MLTVNCGAIPETLIESEFFGYKKGAFTGATADKQGYLSKAEGSSLFLDEIGEIRPLMQIKLLRIIDGSEFTPVGGTESIPADVRFIAATNRAPLDLVRTGSLREDFFYRINIIPIHLPPLRERKGDLPSLIEHFLVKYGGDRKDLDLGTTARKRLLGHDWPGNVRELENVICRYLAIGNLDVTTDVVPTPVTSHTLPAGLPESARINYHEAVERFERQLLLDALAENRWHRERTASALGLSRRTFFRKLKRLSLNLEQGDPDSRP
jgi:transcriptional regulator with PAS, ATPase and Fis domain